MAEMRFLLLLLLDAMAEYAVASWNENRIRSNELFFVGAIGLFF